MGTKSLANQSVSFNSRTAAGWSHTVLILSMSIGVRRPMLIGSWRVKSLLICRCRRRPNMNLLSISRLPRHSDSPFRRRSSLALTIWSN